MGKYKISLNQLAEYSGASDATKRRIIRQQINPDPFRVPWYQRTKAGIKRCIALKGDLSPVLEAIRIIESQPATTRWQVNNRNVSLEALKRFIKIKMPVLLRNLDFQVIRPENRSILLSEVDVIVAPEIVLKGKQNGKTVYGGVKLHISKNKPFDLRKSQYVASVIYKYLKDVVAGSKDVVLPELCLCLDVFNERLVPATGNVEEDLQQLRELCNEIKTLWDRAGK